jgi:hypothetical protein
MICCLPDKTLPPHTEDPGYFRSSLKITGLNPSGQHATTTPGSSYHSGCHGLPPNLSVIINGNIVSHAHVQNSFGRQQYSSTWNTCPSLKTVHGPLYFALIGGSLNTSLVSKRLSTVISTYAFLSKQTPHIQFYLQHFYDLWKSLHRLIRNTMKN